MYNGVLFDLDNTLHDYSVSHISAKQSMFREIERKFNIPMNQINDAYEHGRKSLKAQIMPVYDTSGEFIFIQRMLELLDVNVLAESISLYEHYEDVLLKSLKPFDFAIELLELLKSNNKKICVITNSQVKIQIKKLQALKMAQYLDFIVSSEEANNEKPHPYIFYSALDKLKLGPHEVCMVGDNYDKDITGAALCKIKPFWLNLNKDCREIDETVTKIESLKELVEYLS